MKKLMHRSEGFTLIELMIVILIIAILVAIAVPVYLNARKNAQKRTCQANLRTADGAVQQFAAEQDDGAYPTLWTQISATQFKKEPACPESAVPLVAAGRYVLVGPDDTTATVGTTSVPHASCPNNGGHTI